jgi:hypothetical protein
MVIQTDGCQQWGSLLHDRLSLRKEKCLCQYKLLLGSGGKLGNKHIHVPLLEGNGSVLEEGL